MPLVKEHLLESQRVQQCLYDQPAQPCEFQPGARSLFWSLTLPASSFPPRKVPRLSWSRLALWTTICSRPPGRQRPDQIYHINLLKQKMLQLGVIEPFNSLWSSPIVLVPKPNGTFRFCNDLMVMQMVCPSSHWQDKMHTCGWNFLLQSHGKYSGNGCAGTQGHVQWPSAVQGQWYRHDRQRWVMNWRWNRTSLNVINFQCNLAVCCGEGEWLFHWLFHWHCAMVRMKKIARSYF